MCKWGFSIVLVLGIANKTNKLYMKEERLTKMEGPRETLWQLRISWMQISLVTW